MLTGTNSRSTYGIAKCLVPLTYLLGILLVHTSASGAEASNIIKIGIIKNGPFSSDGAVGPVDLSALVAILHVGGTKTSKHIYSCRPKLFSGGANG